MNAVHEFIQFLGARIAEDKAVADDLMGACPHGDHSGSEPEGLLRDYEMGDQPVVGFSASRVLAECEFKSQIVRHLDFYRATGDLDTPIGAALAQLGALMGEIWDTHPAYREEWRWQGFRL